MTETDVASILRGLDDLKGMVESAAIAAMNAREIAADAVQLAADAAANIESVRNDVAAHALLDSQQHGQVSQQIASLMALQRDSAQKSSSEREIIIKQLDGLTEIKTFWTNAQGVRKLLVGTGAIVIAISAIATAMYWGVHFLQWLFG